VDDDTQNDAGGHYITTGVTLVGLGAFALVVSVLIKLFGLQLHFIAPRSMAVFSAGFVAVGAWMVRHGRAAEGVPSSRSRRK